ncbi:hypothetical protein [uncultured Ilyobacter sp.]|uniref:hypothetical protein n=1 Tax=uncultured Ilyobacter sp. TaxID=544433 RepID=UPI002AA69419|nr:hypothetical protein [uncultured Ilyobacter sp.]
MELGFFIKEFKRLTMIYDKNWDTEKISFMANEYYKKLSGLSEKAFIAGVEKCINQYNRFPSIAEMSEQCRVARGSKEVAPMPYSSMDNTALDKLWESFKEDEKRDMKHLAAELMKKIGILPKGYKKGVNPWHDSVLNSVFNTSFKYVVLRKYFKEECIKFGYRWKGECLSTKGWLSFEQTFSQELRSAS